ncbi:MAG: hypothetical protein HYX72_11625 [Acidobacteria bacterium]|nr:hypothetical protein [Acidobacteriota bacterium]
MSRNNQEFDTFTRSVERILAVPKSEILRREAEYRRQAAKNPNRRGPKPKQRSAVRASQGKA